jgi:pentatricopeptide repeat protein
MMLVSMLWLGCAARSIPPEALSEPPAWTTESGMQTARLELVDSLLSAGQPEAALHVIREMRQAGVQSTSLDVLQAEALRAIGLIEDAEVMLLTALKQQRRSPSIHNQLGILYLDQHRLDEAIPCFEDAHRLAPDDAEYSNNLGFSLMSAGRPAEAVEVLRAALRSDATRLRVRNNLGFALVADARPDEAYRVFRSSSPEDEARYNLGVGLELTGSLADAADAYTAALAANPDNARARAALERLALPSPADDEDTP